MQRNRKQKFKNMNISSDSFYLQPLAEADLSEIYTIWTNPHVRKHLFDDETLPIDSARAIIEISIQLFEKFGWGIWGIFFKDNPKMIGFAGFYNFDEPPELQLLYGLLPEYCGKGYAAKLARIMTCHGFEKLKFEKIIGSTDMANKLYWK